MLSVEVRASPEEAPAEEAEGESDSVDAEVQRRDRLIGGDGVPLLGRGLDWWHTLRIRWAEERGLKLALSADALFQGALGGGESVSSASWETALTGRWDLPGRLPLLGAVEDAVEPGARSPVSLNFRFRDREAFGSRAPSELGGDIGAIWGTTDAFNDHGFEIPEFYIRHVVDRWNMEFRYGQLSVDSQLDKYSLRGVKQSFLNRAFSTNPAVAFPRFGAGGTVRWKHSSGWDLIGTVTQVQASQAGDQVDFQLDSSALFHGLQAAYSFDGWGGDPARFQALGWYSDAVEDADLSSGRGISVVLEQSIPDAGLRTFARMAYADKEATDASFLFAAGIGKDVCEDDLFGLGIGFGESSTTNDWQCLLECFYRKQISPEFHITPDVQILFGDGFTGGGNLRIIPGIRGRLAF